MENLRVDGQRRRPDADGKGLFATVENSAAIWAQVLAQFILAIGKGLKAFSRRRKKVQVRGPHGQDSKDGDRGTFEQP